MVRIGSITILAILARSLWRGITRARDGDWRTLGILLGCFGAMIGFVSSGFVHWNLGDQEVAMVFYILMAFVRHRPGARASQGPWNM